MTQSRRPVRKRVMGIMLLASAAALAFASLGFGGYEYITLRNRFMTHVDMLARVVAANSASALAAGDERAAHEVLATLEQAPFVEAAALYDANGHVFVRYPRDGPSTIPQAAGTAGLGLEHRGHVAGFVAVSDPEERPLGMLYLRAATDLAHGSLGSQGLIALVVMAASLLFAYVVSLALQERITRPIHALANTARAVTERGDLSMRAPSMSQNEFAVLSATFNQMLERIDAQSTALKETEQRLRAQIARLDLLHHTTRAIGDRLDLQSIYQVILRRLEDNMPIEFGCVCLYDGAQLIVETIGAKSMDRATRLGLLPKALLPLDQEELAQCIRGELLYEPDLSECKSVFTQRLAETGLGSLVIAPLIVESKVFGVLIAARKRARGFVNLDCEFLRQLSEHVALASHQTRLYTELQQAYDNLRLSQQTLLQQERLRALGQMASGIAHDINNAISPISLYTEALLDHEPTLSERAREYLRTIQRSIADVGQTVTRMREFYRRRDQTTELAPVDLNELAGQTLTLTRARWSDMPQERGIVIEVLAELSAGLPKIMGTESDIRDALTNLIFNAVDAMPEGGRLTLRTRVIEGEPALVELEVADAGVGMDEETKRRCLEPFFTTKGERGTGMGLAMVYGMAQRHHAQIVIDSTPGAGTSFKIRFTAAPEQLSVPANASQLIHPTRQRLLVIDDDPMICDALVRTLQTEGHEVTAVDGGRAGIEVFEEAYRSGRPFDTVITDLGMPYVDGHSVASAVKQRAPRTPVILLTGWGQRFAMEESIPDNIDVVLSKPPKLAELQRALADLQAVCARQEAASSLSEAGASR
jgi:signal transduction histidine kinase/FixJ family two-component response regulator/HAMP domain-containing protein